MEENPNPPAPGSAKCPTRPPASLLGVEWNGMEGEAQHSTPGERTARCGGSPLHHRRVFGGPG